MDNNVLYGMMPEGPAVVGEEYVAKWKLLADAVPADQRNTRPVTLKAAPEGVTADDLTVLQGAGGVTVAPDGTITLLLAENAPAPEAPAETVRSGKKAPEAEFAQEEERDER